MNYPFENIVKNLKKRIDSMSQVLINDDVESTTSAKDVKMDFFSIKLNAVTR